MPRDRQCTLEVCVETPAALEACKGLADRIELCAGLDIGGLTPSPGMMALAAASGLETHVLIRNRPGDFTMTAEDLAEATRTIKAVRDHGLAGVVIGAERDGALDLAALDEMARSADGLDITLHRVIDVVDDPVAALGSAIGLGARRVLTSGAAPSAAQGTEGLNALHAAAEGRIEVMAGGGITSTSVATLLKETEITSFHASCSSLGPLDPRYARLGFGKTARSFDQAELRRLAQICKSPGDPEK